MPSEDRPQRDCLLHPSSILFRMIEVVGRTIWAAAILLLTRQVGLLFILALTILPGIVYALAAYAVFRWRLDPDELVLREGVVFRRERSIPYKRIQNIDIVENPLHRLFGVVEAKIQTAGGSEPEAHLRVLGTEAVETIRHRVFAGRQAGSAASGEEAPQVEASHVLLQADAGELALYGLIANRGMTLIAAGLGLFWQLSYEMDPDMSWLQRGVGEAAAESLRDSASQLNVLPPALTFLYGLTLFVALLLLVRVLSIPWAWFRLWGFSLTREGDDLRAVYGAFTRHSATIPRHRIQLVTIRRSWLHRLLGRAEIRVDTAGGREEGDKAELHRRVLAPIVRESEVPRLIAEIAPELSFEGREWRSLDPQAVKRVLRRTLIAWSLALVPGVWYGGLPFLVFAGLILPGWLWIAREQVRRRGWSSDEQGVYVRKGWLERYETAAPMARVQGVELRRNPFDRRWRMSRIQMDTAGAAKGGPRLVVPYLSEGRARKWFDEISLEAASRRFHW